MVKNAISRVQMQQPVVALFSGVVDVRLSNETVVSPCPLENGESAPRAVGAGSLGGRGLAEEELCVPGLDSAENVEFIRAGSIIYYGAVLQNVGSATAFRVTLEPPYPESVVVCARREDGSEITDIGGFSLQGGTKAFLVYAFVFGADQTAGLKQIAKPRISSYTAVDSATAKNHVGASNVDGRQKTTAASELTASPIRSLQSFSSGFSDTTGSLIKPGERLAYEICAEVPEGFWPDPGLLSVHWAAPLSLLGSSITEPRVGAALSGNQVTQPAMSIASDIAMAEFRFGEVNRRPGTACDDPLARRVCFSLSLCLAETDPPTAASGKEVFVRTEIPNGNGTVSRSIDDFIVAIPALQMALVPSWTGQVRANDEIEFEIRISHDASRSRLSAYDLSLSLPFSSEIGSILALENGERGQVDLTGAGGPSFSLDEFTLDDEVIVLHGRAKLRSDLIASSEFTILASLQASTGPAADTSGCSSHLTISASASMSVRSVSPHVDAVDDSQEGLRNCNDTAGGHLPFLSAASPPFSWRSGSLRSVLVNVTVPVATMPGFRAALSSPLFTQSFCRIRRASFDAGPDVVIEQLPSGDGGERNEWFFGTVAATTNGDDQLRRLLMRFEIEIDEEAVVVEEEFPLSLSLHYGPARVEQEVFVTVRPHPACPPVIVHTSTVEIPLSSSERTLSETRESRTILTTDAPTSSTTAQSEENTNDSKAVSSAVEVIIADPVDEERVAPLDPLIVAVSAGAAGCCLLLCLLLLLCCMLQRKKKSRKSSAPSASPNSTEMSARRRQSTLGNRRRSSVAGSAASGGRRRSSVMAHPPPLLSSSGGSLRSSGNVAQAGASGIASPRRSGGGRRSVMSSAGSNSPFNPSSRRRSTVSRLDRNGLVSSGSLAPNTFDEDQLEQEAAQFLNS